MIFSYKKETLETVLSYHIPKIIHRGYSQSGSEVPDGASHFYPIWNDWRDTLDPSETITILAEKTKISAAAIKNTDEKKKASQKTTANTTSETNTLN